VKVQASPPVLDAVREPFVDATNQQASISMDIEVGYTTSVPVSHEDIGNIFYTSPCENQSNNTNVHESLSAWFKKVMDDSLTKKPTYAKIDLLQLLKNVDGITRLKMLIEEFNPCFSPY
jgi:hypothetical protein